MKPLFFKRFAPCVLLGVFVLLSLGIKAQNLDEKTLREKMKNDGLPPLLIEKLIKERRMQDSKIKILQDEFQKSQILNPKSSIQNPVPFAACSDMGGENGWGAWQATTGTANTGSQSWGGPFSPPTSPRFNLTSGAGVDPCTPALNPPNAPSIPVVAPGFGNTSIQLGQPQTAGCGAERLTYQLTVTPADTNFVFAYAIVIQDAGHTVPEQPFVELCIRDASNNPIQCGCFRYTGGPNLPGFYQATCGWGTYYKPWTIVGINLNSYVGQTLTVTIKNVDCSQCGHFAHSYWDFTCRPLSSAASSYCIGQSASICGPRDPQINYTYQWYQNGNIYTGPPNATSQCITPMPQPGDTFVVQVSQPSGCNFSMTYVPQPMTVNPNFNFAINCGTVTFTNTTTTSNGSPITSWNWTFPGGSPASSTVQNPVVTYPAGNYTVTLIATSQSGCSDTIAQTVSVTGLPQAVFSSTTVCQGNFTQFSDGSVPGVGDPIVGWAWSFPSGNPSSSVSQNPSVLYPSGGTYTASLTVTTQQGCTNTITQTITVNPKPAANLSGVNVCFNNVSTFNDLSTGNNTISNWSWNFGDGSPLSPLQNPGHTYSSPGSYIVTLIVTNNYGCIDTNSITVVVNPLPVTSFSSTTVCFGDTSCFNNTSTISSGSITGWSWNFADPSSPNNISNLQNPCHVFTNTGPFIVILTATSDSGCQSTTNVPVNLNSLPVANFTSQNVCLNFIAGFTDVSVPPQGDPINAWSWNFGNTPAGTSALQNPSYLYNTAGTYTATLVVTTTKGCKDTVTNPITVYALPVAALTKPDSGCSPVITGFNDSSTSADGAITSWQWSFPGGLPSSSIQQNPSGITYNTPGTYNVSLIVMTNFGCRDTVLMPQYINVFSWPNADFGTAPSETSVDVPSFSFTDLWSSDVTSWSWDYGDGSAADSININPVHSYSAVVTNNDYYTFRVCLKVKNKHGCWDSTCHYVKLLPEFTFFIPNAFTPNDDKDNQFFFGKGRGIKDYTIWLFDRWGNMIWTCHYEGKNTDWDQQGKDGMPSACKWDGKVLSGNGNIVQEDVYVWKVRLTDIFDKQHKYIGSVTVVK